MLGRNTRARASVFDMKVMLALGLAGILFRVAGYPLAPIVIAIILGPILEANLRCALPNSREGHRMFLDRPVAAIPVAVGVLPALGAVVFACRKRSERIKAAWSASQSGN